MTQITDMLKKYWIYLAGALAIWFFFLKKKKRSSRTSRRTSRRKSSNNPNVNLFMSNKVPRYRNTRSSVVRSRSNRYSRYKRLI